MRSLLLVVGYVATSDVYVVAICSIAIYVPGTDFLLSRMVLVAFLIIQPDFKIII